MKFINYLTEDNIDTCKLVSTRKNGDINSKTFKVWARILVFLKNRLTEGKHNGKFFRFPTPENNKYIYCNVCDRYILNNEKKIINHILGKKHKLNLVADKL